MTNLLSIEFVSHLIYQMKGSVDLYFIQIVMRYLQGQLTKEMTTTMLRWLMFLPLRIRCWSVALSSRLKSSLLNFESIFYLISLDLSLFVVVVRKCHCLRVQRLRVQDSRTIHPLLLAVVVPVRTINLESAATAELLLLLQRVTALIIINKYYNST